MSDSPFKFKRFEDCPDAKKLHSPTPKNMDDDGYSPTKEQVRCPTCGFYARWIPRKKEPA